MTWPRFIYMSAFFFTALLYLLFSQYEAFLMFALICSLPVLSLLLLYIGQKLTVIDFGDQTVTVVCGEAIHVPIQIKNRFCVSTTDISMRILEKERSGKILKHRLFSIDTFIFHVGTVEYMCHMTCCGKIEICIDRIIFQDLLHLFSYKRPVAGTYVVLVMPQLCQDTDGINSSGNVSELIGAAGELAWIKPYRFGDNSRYIHWKASAAHDDVYMREFYAQREEDAVLLFDIPFQAEEKICNAVYEVFYAVGVHLLSIYGGFTFYYRQENDILCTKHIRHTAYFDQQLTEYMRVDRTDGVLMNLQSFVENGRGNYHNIFYISTASENAIMNLSGNLYPLMTLFVIGNHESIVDGSGVVYIDPNNVAGSLAGVWQS